MNKCPASVYTEHAYNNHKWTVVGLAVRPPLVLRLLGRSACPGGKYAPHPEEVAEACQGRLKRHAREHWVGNSSISDAHDELTL